MQYPTDPLQDRREGVPYFDGNTADDHRSGAAGRRWLILGAKILLSAGLIGLLLYNVDWWRLSASLAAADTGLLLVAFCLLALTIPLAAERWRSSAQAVKVSFSHGFFLHATYVAVFAGQFLPAGIGVDAARLGFLWHRKVLLRLAFQSILIDRLVGLAAIFLLMFGGIPFVVRALPEPAVVPVIGLAATLLVVCAGLLLIDKLPFACRFRTGHIGRLMHLIQDVRKALRTRSVLGALVCGIMLHALSIAAVLVVARALGHALEYWDLLTVVSFAIFAALLPISMNGWGVREGAMVLGLSFLSVNKETSVLISFLFGAGAALAALPGGLAWLRLKAAQ